MKVTRRDLLVSAAAFSLSSLKADAIGVSDPASASTSPKQKVIVAGGHPGDPEYGCGGTISRLTSLGHSVTLLYLNNGAWPPTSAETRIAEAAEACEILKAKPLYANQENGHAIIDNIHYDAYAKLLNAEKPDVVITQWPIDNHRDHRAIAALTYDAWNNAKRGFALYYYEVSDGEDTLQFSPTRYIDISDREPVKRAACYAHASQTPDRYYKLQDDIAAFRGLESGYRRAEAFVWQQRSPSDPLQLLTNR